MYPTIAGIRGFLHLFSVYPGQRFMRFLVQVLWTLFAYQFFCAYMFKSYDEALLNVL